MAKAKYQTPEYRAAKREADAAQARGEWLICAEVVCKYQTRDIAPDQGNDIAHDESGTVILGPAHPHCNRADGGRRRHQSPTHRWVL